MIPILLMAAVFQDTAALDRAVGAFTTRPIGAEGGARTPVDPRLRLALCPTVSLSWRTEGHDAVVVACDGPAWRIFVPVIRPQAAAAPSAQLAIIAQPKQPPVIKRGDPIVIEAGSDGFAISREGTAMGDAAPGGRFLVKVDDSRTPVQAIAVSDGKATLPGWSE